MKAKDPVIGKTCPALINENYEYHLSGDAKEFCKCAINGRKCLGRVITDPDDQSNRFFSRGKCGIHYEKIKDCPVYGVSSEILKIILKHKAEQEMDEKINLIK